MIWPFRRVNEEKEKEIDLEKIHYRWMNVYSDPTSSTGLRHYGTGKSKKEADEYAKHYINENQNCKRVACVLFTYELGDGL